MTVKTTKVPLKTFSGSESFPLISRVSRFFDFKEDLTVCENAFDKIRNCATELIAVLTCVRGPLENEMFR